MAGEDGDASYLLLHIGGGAIALPVAAVQRILPFAELTPTVPPVPDILGHLDVGGSVLPVLDPGPRLGRGPTTPQLSSLLLLLEGGGRRWLALVDGVVDIAAVSLVTGNDGVRLARTAAGELLPVVGLEALAPAAPGAGA